MSKFNLIFLLVLLGTCQVFAATISGTITYEKVVHTHTGGSSVSSVIQNTPVANAKIYNGTSEIGTTNSDGTYSVSVTGTVTLTVASDDGTTVVGTALSGSGISGIYEVTIFSGTVSSDVSNNDVLITVSNNSGAFNLLSQFQIGLAYFETYGQTFPSNQTVRVLWPASGSYFEPDNLSLGFLGTGSDTDEFDDSVIQHEVGHLAMEVFSVDNSLGGQHLFTSREDLRLSWSEGVANYLSCAIRGTAEYLDTTNYNSSTQSSFVGITDSFADTPTVKGTDNEFSVAHVLWNARAQAGDQAVVDTLISFTGLSEQISMDSFHDQWESLQPNTSLSTYYTTAGMDYFVDTSGGSFSSPGTLTTSSTISDLTFFEKNDEDVFSFVPSNSGIYTFSTSSTSNGALTSLFLYNSSQTQLATNNQANGFRSDTTSSITYSGLVAGETYFVKASRFNSTTLNYGIGWTDGYTSTVGSYGGYSLSAVLNSVVEPEVTSVSIVNSSAVMGDTLSITFSTSADPVPNSFVYTWLRNGVAISGQTSSTLTLNSSLGVSKGDSITCSVVPVYQGVTFTNNGATSSALVISNSAPTVDAGEDISFSDTSGLTRGVHVTDVDEGESYTYSWNQTSGPTVTVNTATNTMSFVPNGSGTYAFTVTVSDGTDSGSDSVSFIFDEFYVEPTTREDVTAEQLGWLESPSVSNATEAGNLLDQAFVVAQTTLADNVVSGVLSAVEAVVNSNVALSANQVSQALASFDNVVDENAALASALNESQVTATSNLLKEVLMDNSGVVSTKDYLKALEVFSEILEPYASGSGVKANLSNTVEESLGQDLAAIVDAAAGQLAVGETISYEQDQLTVLACAYTPSGTAEELQDSTGQLSMSIPANFSGSSLAASVTKYTINPHADNNSDVPNSEVVSFKIRTLSTLQDVSFGSQVVTLKMPVSGTPGVNQSFVPRYFDTTTNTWSTSGITLPTGFADVSGEVFFQVDHLTDFGVFIEGSSASSSAGSGGGGGGCMLGAIH